MFRLVNPPDAEEKGRTMRDLTGNDLLNIRQMCDAFGVTPRTLRFYESRDLVSPQRDGQQRLYGRRDRARLTLILRGKRFGFSLDQMRELLDLYDPAGDNRAQAAATLAAARERLADMRRRQAELREAIAELSARIAEAEACTSSEKSA